MNRYRGILEKRSGENCILRQFIQTATLWICFGLNIYRRLDSVQIWKAFAITYPLEGGTFIRRKSKWFNMPNMRIKDYLGPLKSSNYQWIVFLSLSSLSCSRSDLWQISALPNLGSLMIGPKISAEGIGLDDSVIRNWGRLAVISNAFKMLRVLVLRLQKEITGRIFPHLRSFPSLSFVIIESNAPDRPLKPDGRRHGWDYQPYSEWQIKSGVTDEVWDTVMHACFGLGAWERGRDMAQDPGLVDSLPRLHLSLGASGKHVFQRWRQGTYIGYFIRSKEALPVQAHTNDGHSKRPLPTDRTTNFNKASKKPVIRASKQQRMEDVLTELHS